jgi:hypothetical protein
MLGTIIQRAFGATLIEGEDGVTYLTSESWPVGALVRFDVGHVTRFDVRDGILAEKIRMLEAPRVAESASWWGRTWRAVILRAGGRSAGGDVWTRESAEVLAPRLRGVLVAQPPDGVHLAHEELATHWGPREQDLLGYVREALVIEGDVIGTIRLFDSAKGRAASENLLKNFYREQPLPGLSVVALTDREPMLVFRQEGAARISEGMKPVVSGVREVLCVDLVAWPLAGGRFLLPTIG